MGYMGSTRSPVYKTPSHSQPVLKQPYLTRNTANMKRNNATLSIHTLFRRTSPCPPRRLLIRPILRHTIEKWVRTRRYTLTTLDRSASNQMTATRPPRHELAAAADGARRSIGLRSIRSNQPIPSIRWFLPADQFLALTTTLDRLIRALPKLGLLQLYAPRSSCLSMDRPNMAGSEMSVSTILACPIEIARCVRQRPT